MANRAPAPDTLELRAHCGAFVWTADNAARTKDFMSRGHMLPDTTALHSAIDAVFGECDR